MILAISAVLAANVSMHTARQQQPPRRDRPSVVRDSSPVDSMKRRAPKRLAVTAELRRTAFDDDRSREFFLTARRARVDQDSSVKGYDATARERTTVRMSIGKAVERIMYRRESAFRVRWQDGVGARVEVTGARVGIPIAPKSAEQEALEETMLDAGLTPIPYYPGQDALWGPSGTSGAEVDDQRIVHPLADGAEAYYTYSAGDSMSWRLPDGKTVRLRELKVRPRSPEWNLAVGSLWFDTRTGQLVRAAYRLSAPMNVLVRAENANREDRTVSPVAIKVLKAIASPMRVEISAVVIEYGLFDGRYWLPRARTLEGTQQISFAKLRIEIGQAFSYDAINGPATLAQIVINQPDDARPETPDSLTGKDAVAWRDSVSRARRTARKAFNDSLKAAPCDSTGYRVVGRRRTAVALPVAVRFPCDVQSLATSPDLPGSLYEPNETLLGKGEADALIADALPFGAQAALALGALPAPNFQYGLSMTRYNRVEGLSSGVMVEEELGAGYLATAIGRIGTADRQPNVELSLSRTNASKTLTLTGYNRLVSASDWGNPLSFGSSFSALVFGRDEGFYYRASGADVQWTSERGARLDWRLFAEEQRTAVQRTRYSFGASFEPNIAAARGAYAGAGVHWVGTTGLDPRGLRTLTDVRIEAAGGDSTYGRAAADITLSTGLPKSFAASLTLAGGTSVGHLPMQRQWFLGGTQTIRGQSADPVQHGNAFWMSRVELGADLEGYRLVTFGDLGWTGDRSAVSDLVRPMSGAGIGMSMFDGMIRFDVARGFHPRRQTRLALYLGTRF